MAPKQIKPFIGSQELATLLEIINNKEAYAKALTEINDARDKANKAFDDLQVGKDVESAMAAAAEAHAVVDEAQARAAAIIDEANEAALRLEADAQAMLEDAERISKSAGVAAKEQRGKLNKLEGELTAKAQEQDEREVRLNKREKELNQIKDGFSARESAIIEAEVKVAKAMEALK